MRLKTVQFLMVIGLALLLAAPNSFAGEKYGKGYKKKMGLDEKVCKKFDMICDNKDELDLSEEQEEKLMEAKVEFKKAHIEKEADIKLVYVDIKRELYEDEIDVQKVDELIDEKYKYKAQKAKATVAAYAAIKLILSDEQMDDLKGLYEECERDKEYEKKAYYYKKHHKKGYKHKE